MNVLRPTGCGSVSDREKQLRPGPRLGPGNGFQRGVMKHPSEQEWDRFFQKNLTAEAALHMARHLERCELCVRLASRMPAPPYRCLGRPVPPVIMVPPEEIEAHAEALLGLCQRRLREGGLVIVAGDWRSEALLYQLLSLTTARLRRRGHSVELCGVALTSDEPPPRPDVEFACLLEAPTYTALDQWTDQAPGRVAVLAGHIEEWGRLGVTPDLVGVGQDQLDLEAALAPYRDAAREAFLQADSRVRSGILLNALSLDLPRAFFPAAEPPPLFAALEDMAGRRLDFYSVACGQWLVREAVRDLWRGRQEVVARALSGLGPALAPFLIPRKRLTQRLADATITIGFRGHHPGS